LLEKKKSLENFLKKLKSQKNRYISKEKLTEDSFTRIYKQATTKLEKIKELILLISNKQKEGMRLWNESKEYHMIVSNSKIIDMIIQDLCSHESLLKEEHIGNIFVICEIFSKRGYHFVLFEKKGEPNKFEELARYSRYGVFGVIGNDCLRIEKCILNGKKVFDLHEKPQVIGEFVLIGQEGASRDTPIAIGFTLYSEEEIEDHLNQQLKGNENKKIILVSHSPPHGILDRGIRFSQGDPIGSSAIRNFIEKNEVILNICGHVHSMGGKYKKLKKCTVLNIASHDDKGAKGRIAIIDIDNENINTKLTELPPSNLEAIYGIGPVYSDILKKAGIKTIKEFASLDPKEIAERAKLSQNSVYKWHIHAKSLLNDEIILFEHLNIDNPIFVDIETDRTQSFVWMICVFDPIKNICKQFTAYEEREEKKILREFLDFVSKQEYKRLYCYSGTDFEERVLKNRIAEHKLDENKCPVFEDLLYTIRDLLVVPLATYRLKVLGSFLGFEWKHPDISGWDAPRLYNEFLQSKDKKIIKKLQEYNRDDVLVLCHILKKIKKMKVEKAYSVSELQKL